MQNYVTMEICVVADTGRIAAPVNAFESVEDARVDFYGKCKNAVKSSYLTHTVLLMNASGSILEGPKCFRHEPAATPDDGGEEVTPE